MSDSFWPHGLQHTRLPYLSPTPITLYAKNPPTMREPQETWVWSLDQEDPLVEGTATHSSILSWRIPWIEELGRLQPIGLPRAGHNWSDLAWHNIRSTCGHFPRWYMKVSKAGSLFKPRSKKKIKHSVHCVCQNQNTFHKLSHFILIASIEIHIIMSILYMRKPREILLASNCIATNFSTNLFDTQTKVLVAMLQDRELSHTGTCRTP